MVERRKSGREDQTAATLGTSGEAESPHSDAERGPDYHTLAFLLYSVDRVFLPIFFFF